MMIRSLLFLLFLVILLVWIVAFYLGGEVVQRGLFWTGVCVAALLAWLIFDRVYGWMQLRRSKNSAKPVAPTAAATSIKPSHPDNVAFRQLIEEANKRLEQSDSLRGTASTIFDLPLFLVMGLEGAGKTSVIQNSGMEPHLLAGQTTGGGQDAGPTRIANIWLAKGAVYIEISGRIFGSDAARFAEWLQELAPKPKLSKMEARLAGSKMGSFLATPASPANLRGVILVSDMREFIRTPDISKLDRAASAVRERLDAVGAQFGVGCPVYLLFSRTDQIQYFREFFARISDNDAGQVFGTLTATDARHTTEEVWAEAETRRLNGHFNQLFLKLSDRRLLALTTEPQMELRTSIYEFPREFKRARTPLVQYLVDIFKPNPLTVSPQLRGFFFTGTRMVETAILPSAGATRIIPGGGDAGATQIFQPGATQIFSAGVGDRGPTPGARVPGWMFLAEAFNKVFPRDNPVLSVVSKPVSSAPAWAKVAVPVACALAALLVILWTVSWWGNASLISDTRREIEAMNRQPKTLTVSSLQPVDELRGTLEQLSSSRPWSMRWGLYSGDDVLKTGQEAYFWRLKALFLDSANASLLASFSQRNPSQSNSLYDRLKTHLTIANKACPVDEPLVSGVLKQTIAASRPGLDAETIQLIGRQLGYYAQVLNHQPDAPVVLSSDPAAVSAAQTILQNANGFEPQLNELLTQVSKQVPKISTAERVPDYTRVLTGPAEFRGEFTKNGARIVESLIEEGKWGGAGEECVTGKHVGLAAGVVQSSESKKQLRDLYYLRYAEAWRAYLREFRVNAFQGRADAAKKLDTLSGSQSPLLMVVKLVAENTNFPAKSNESSLLETTAQKVGLGGLVDQYKNAEKKAQEVQQIVQGPAGLTAGDVTTLMQPVQVTTPPALGVLVNDANKDYVAGLRALQTSLESMSRGTDADVLALIPQAQQALAQAKGGYRALTDRFADAGNQGLNRELADLLEQPIRYANGVIPPSPTVFSAGKQNGDLKQMCSELSPALTKYPFNPTSNSDASLADVVKAFGPGNGVVWKYQKDKLGEVVALQGHTWMAAKPSPKVASGLLNFLNRAQQLSEIFFPGGNPTAAPHVTYSLRRVTDKPGLTLRLDGKDMNTAASSFQVEFSWPATSSSDQGASGRIGDANLSSGFGQYPGMWGVFRFFQYADDRQFGDRLVQWSQIRGPGVATPQSINPPAKIEFVHFPNDVDLFNPRFFDGLRCPTQAVIPE